MEEQIYIHYGDERFVLYMNEVDGDMEVVLAKIEFEVTQSCQDWFGEGLVGAPAISLNEAEAEEMRNQLATKNTKIFLDVETRKNVIIHGDGDSGGNYAWLKLHNVGMELYTSESTYVDGESHKKYKITITPRPSEMYGKKIAYEQMKSGGFAYISNYVRKLLKDEEYRKKEKIK